MKDLNREELQRYKKETENNSKRVFTVQGRLNQSIKKLKRLEWLKEEMLLFKLSITHKIALINKKIKRQERDIKSLENRAEEKFFDTLFCSVSNTSGIKQECGSEAGESIDLMDILP